MSDTAVKKHIQKLQRAIVDGLEDVKAQDIQVFNTESLSPLFERVIIASGTSNRQTKALAASVRDAVREAGFDKPRTEGEDNGEWIIVDCGAAVVHVMQPTIRQYYRLEEIWGEKPVRIKHAANAKVARPSEPMDGSDAPVARKAPAKKASARKAVPEVAARMPGKPAGKAPAKVAGKPAAKAAGKSAAKVGTKAPAKAAGTAPARKSPARAPATKTARSTPAKVVKVGADGAKAPARKAAAKTTASRAAAGSKAPARKPAAKASKTQA